MFNYLIGVFSVVVVVSGFILLAQAVAGWFV